MSHFIFTLYTIFDLLFTAFQCKNLHLKLINECRRREIRKWVVTPKTRLELEICKIDFEPLLMHYIKGKWHESYWNFLNFKKIANLAHLEDKIFWVKIEKMHVLYPSHFFNFWRIFDLFKIEFWQRRIVAWNIYCISVPKFTLKSW